MAVSTAPAHLTLRPFDDFGEANEVWPRGDRPAAIRAAAASFRRRFKDQGQIHAVQCRDLLGAPYETRFAFGGATRTPFPFVYLIARLMVVAFDDFEGRRRHLMWEPMVLEGSRETPYYAKLADFWGSRIADIFAPFYARPETALAEMGLRTEDVDFVVHDHLHVQDMRCFMGTTRPVDGERVPRPPLFPDAHYLVQRSEFDTLRAMHPMQVGWYVDRCLDGVPEERLVLLDGDVELGVGVALVTTPGHTDGNQSLVLNTPDGVWVSSENGVAADSWQPELSRIPGLRRYCRFWEREVVMNSNTLEDSIDQYDSMIKEKALADRSPRDPRWLNILPSAELARFRRHWPARPTFFHGGIHHGRVAG